MKRKIISVMMVTVLCAIIATYLIPYLQVEYSLSIVQGLLLLVILVVCVGIITAGAVEYIISIPLNIFLNKIEHNWDKYKSIDISLDNENEEQKAILNTISRITLSQTKRINELSNVSGNSDSYQRLFITVSHQLRTPITGLKWAFSIIEQKISKGQQPDPALIIGASEALTRISVIIEQLLTNFDEQSKSIPPFTSVDIEQYIDYVLKESILLSTQQDIHISIVKETELIPLITGRELEVGFVLHSIITNAIHYSTKGSTVTITLNHDKNNVIIKIHNFGKTILESERAVLFSEFSRSAEAIRLYPNGSGLGLYLANQIVIAHNGSIDFQSDDKLGTIFTVTFPISSRGQLESSINY